MTRDPSRSHINEYFVYQCPYCNSYTNTKGEDFVTREEVQAHITTKTIAEEYQGKHQRGHPERIRGLTRDEYEQLTDPTYEYRQEIQELQQRIQELEHTIDIIREIVEV